MSVKSVFTAATVAALVPTAPLAAYEVATRGPSRASPQLTVNLLRAITAYSKRINGCSMLMSADRAILPAGFRPAAGGVAVRAKGGHYERWLVNVCARKSLFLISTWPSPRGGADYAIRPLRVNMPLATTMAGAVR